MMEHIIKNLEPKDVGSILLILGLVREARLWHKQVLEQKQNSQNKK
ncbi:hypothetical protein [Streptococcus ruminantium]|nr:hypothetical protein [Streptococcus ruminantium]